MFLFLYFVASPAYSPVLPNFHQDEAEELQIEGLFEMNNEVANTLASSGFDMNHAVESIDTSTMQEYVDNEKIPKLSFVLEPELIINLYNLFRLDAESNRIWNLSSNVNLNSPSIIKSPLHGVTAQPLQDDMTPPLHGDTTPPLRYISREEIDQTVLTQRFLSIREIGITKVARLEDNHLMVC